MEPKLTPGPLMELATAFWKSKTITSSVELELFTHITNGNNTIQLLQESTGIEERPLSSLLTALIAMKLITINNGSYNNEPISNAFLVKNKPGYFGDMILMQGTRLYKLWDHLTEAIEKNNAAKEIFDDIQEDEETKSSFIAAMHNNAIGPANALGNIIDFSEFSSLLDVGGGSGAYPIILSRKFENIKSIIFDYESVCNTADKYIKNEKLEDRIKTVAGDVLLDDLPAGNDVILISQVIHSYCDDNCRKIFKKCYDSLPNNGLLIINEFFLDDDKQGPLFPALFGINMLIESSEGKSYSKNEIMSILKEIGFNSIDKGVLAGPVGYITARK